MEAFTSSELKTILHSKRANLYYLEHCRVLVKDGCVEYVTEEGKKSLYWNIPIANTTSLLLGTGTSITRDAMRELGKAGVMVGFCGGGGSPLFSAQEVDVDIAWFSPQSEYRPTQYLQQWVSFWFDDNQRLAAAKLFQQRRLQLLAASWTSPTLLQAPAFTVPEQSMQELVKRASAKIANCHNTRDLLSVEASLTKQLYKKAATLTGYGNFTRIKRGEGIDLANRFLDHGNYLAYGLGATAAWVLGLPHGLAVLHGKTRRGGLVFDIADLIKDAIVLPNAFIAAVDGDDSTAFRARCIRAFNRFGALDHMIDTIKTVAETLAHSTNNPPTTGPTQTLNTDMLHG